MSFLETFGSDEYPDGRTKQAFRDQTDINKILARAAQGESISHLAKHGATYGDFTDMPDLLEASRRLAVGQRIFDELPGEVRREFHQSASAFFAFVNDPANVDRLPELLPDLARPGTQMPVVRTTPQNVETAVTSPAVSQTVPAPANQPPAPDGTSPEVPTEAS